MTTEAHEPPDMLESEMAALLGVTPNGIAHMRQRGDALPPAYLIGRRRRYRRSEVLAWIEERRIEQPARTDTIPVAQ